LFYRPVPEVEPGPVNPLGGGLSAGLPDGFWTLFAPAAMLPASVLIPLPVEFPVVVPGVVVPGVVVPLMDPVPVPLVVDPPADVPPLVEPVPVCAMAKVLANVSAAANPRLLSFIAIFPFRLRKEKTIALRHVPSSNSIGCDGSDIGREGWRKSVRRRVALNAASRSVPRAPLSDRSSSAQPLIPRVLGLFGRGLGGG
jgi:hypothetical protein